MLFSDSLLGKPLGISLFTFLAVKILKTPLMTGIYWHPIIGAGILGGIGFTMSLFISDLSFSIPEYTNLSKLGIMMASIISGTLGVVVLGYWGERKS